MCGRRSSSVPFAELVSVAARARILSAALRFGRGISAAAMRGPTRSTMRPWLRK